MQSTSRLSMLLLLALASVAAGPTSKPSVYTPSRVAELIPKEDRPANTWDSAKAAMAEKAIEKAMKGQIVEFNIPVNAAKSAGGWTVYSRAAWLKVGGDLFLTVQFEFPENSAKLAAIKDGQTVRIVGNVKLVTCGAMDSGTKIGPGIFLLLDGCEVNPPHPK